MEGPLFFAVLVMEKKRRLAQEMRRICRNLQVT